MEVRVASSFRRRLFGLALLRAPRHALVIPGCRSVHTFGMRVPLDLHWLAADGRVIRVDGRVRPGRVRRCREAAAVLEIPMTTLSRSHKRRPRGVVLGEMILSIRCLRRRRVSTEHVEDRLQRYGKTFAAPPAAKQAGLERVLHEFRRGRDREP